jgi:branched-chain amino acid transport system ATP-binding protein/urea transport system ATP-binding protein
LIELAMVLAGQPRLVLLDEPAAGMTAEERGRLASALRDLAGQMSLIVVEHDMQFIKDIATEITVFHRGGVFIEGDVAEIMAHSEVQEIYLGKEANVAA